MQEEKYVGSPGLAMSILKEADRYIFFDLDEMALQSIHLFARTHGLTPSVELHHQDSIAGMMELLPLLPKTALYILTLILLTSQGQTDILIWMFSNRPWLWI